MNCNMEASALEQNKSICMESLPQNPTYNSELGQKKGN